MRPSVVHRGTDCQAGKTQQTRWLTRHAVMLHKRAAMAFPQVENMEPEQFAKLLSASEIALGAALVAVPVVPPFLAGLGLLAFSGGLNRLYLKTPGASRESSLAPTPQGIPLAKDVWLTSIGGALVLDSLFARRRRR
jgi:ABC-type glucose/galactose transport system permease subunit